MADQAISQAPTGTPKALEQSTRPGQDSAEPAAVQVTLTNDGKPSKADEATSGKYIYVGVVNSFADQPFATRPQACAQPLAPCHLQRDRGSTKDRYYWQWW